MEGKMLIENNAIGWQNVHAGLNLIVWSKLALWDTDNLKLIAKEDENLKTYNGYKDIHLKYGRLICWIAFGIGSEYLIKGVCLLLKNEKGLIINIKNKQLDNSDILHLSMAQLAHIIYQFIGDSVESVQIKKSLINLAKSIRNRDVHSYEKDVRGSNYLSVKKIFIPLLNIMLKKLNEAELRTNMAILDNE